jgi:hypothetical protein
MSTDEGDGPVVEWCGYIGALCGAIAGFQLGGIGGAILGLIIGFGLGYALALLAIPLLLIAAIFLFWGVGK